MTQDTSKRVLEVVVPVAPYRDVEQAASKHAPRSGLKGKRAALLPSEKSSSPPFMEVLVRRMAAQTDAAHVFMQRADWPFFHPLHRSTIGPEIDKVARACDAVISGVAY